MKRIKEWFNSPLDEKSLPLFIVVGYVAVVMIIIGGFLSMSLIDYLINLLF